ncbi:MAG: fused MFS/spermidine synthase [Deltaproteobacteria bacterium]|nr:fused MFS/spermidine synthase [Deltaproteobacteria bacterium]
MKSTHLNAFSLVVLFCFFFSGLASLIYQILWLRMIDKVVGSAPFAVATVLSVFMGGLALGSWLAGKYIDRITSRLNLLSLYGKVEFAIGIYSLLLPLFIYLVKPIYILAYNSLFIHFWLYRIFTFIGCSLLLLVPTILMGITLPVLCRFYVEDLGHIGARTGRLYGINTIGGAAGAALCGFFLIAYFGVWGSLRTAVGINILIGLLCIAMARGGSPIVSIHKNDDKGAVKPNRPKDIEYIPVGDKMIISLALWIFGISGFCSIAYEVFWTRLLGLMLAPTTYSFTLVVSTFIVGLALGNIIFGRLADRAKGVFQLLVITQVCAACLALLVSQFLGNSQFFFAKLIYTFQGDFGEKILVQSIVLFFVLVGPTIFLGAAFPLVNKIYARSLPEIGKSIGTAYAVNTIGAILGSFIAGFILIPLLGKENGIRIVSGLQFSFALLALTYLVFRTGERIRASFTGLISLSLGLLLLINFPSWNHNILSRGWYHQYRSFEKYFNTTSWFEAVWIGASMIAEHVSNTEVVFYGDGIGGFTTAEKWVNQIGTANFTLFNSGKADASSHSDRLTQALSAHIPLLFHPDAENVMVIGLASGMTAGEVLLYPVKQLDVLEINEQVIKAAEIFTPWNNSCLTNPKARIIIQDGRNHLELTHEKYDVIISEPSNPWMAGLANLFTLDYFKTVKGRLSDNGIFVQWFYSYEMDWSTFAMVGRTFAEVFPDGILIKTLSSDFLLVGFSGKKNLDLKTAESRLVYASKSKNITIRDPKVIFNLIISEDLKGLFGLGPLHTDNWPRLEFAAPKNLDKNDFSFEEKIKSNSWLSKETKDIIEYNKGIDSSLDRLELMTADISPPFNDVDLNKATPAQIKRYQDILKDYCSDEYVTNYEIFPNPDLKETCAQIQVGKIQDHLASSRQDSQAYYHLALRLKSLGKTQEQIDAFQKAISLNPSYYNAHMDLAAALQSQGRLEEAVAQFSEALRLNPDSAEPHNELGVIFANYGRTDEAIDHFSKALEINPDSAETHNNIGNVYANQGQIDKAIDHFSKALKIRPGYAATHDNLGRLFADQGRLEDALTQFNQALKNEPDNANFHYDAGLALWQLGQTSASVDQFMEALRNNPKHFSAHYYLGILLLKQKQFDEAADHFSKAIEINPDDPEAHKVLGIAMGNMRRFKEAAGQFSEALKLDPDDPETYDNLGVALTQMGQIEEAIEQFKKAIEIDNSFKKANDHLIIVKTKIKK